MINEQCHFVLSPTIDSAWREAMWLCIKCGYDFLVKGGSYVGQIRKQLDHVTIKIVYPGLRPLSPILPPGIPPPTDEKAVVAYFNHYILGEQVAENEDYTYGSFIAPQLPKAAKLLAESCGNTNQAAIAVGDASSIDLRDPPCLRSIHFKVEEGRLNMFVVFRSWDLFAGMPENLGGLQLLKEYMIAYLYAYYDFSLADGSLIAVSDGLHLYEQYFSLVDTLNTDKVKVGDQALLDKEQFLLLSGE